jgi:hypothetical protein
MDREILEKFFNTLFPNLQNYIEIRYKNNKGEIKRKFISSIKTLIDNLIENEEYIKTFDMWFGVCERDIKLGTKQAISKINCLWADIDGEQQTWQNFEFLPTIVVNSGHGTHLYWVLEEPFKITSLDDVEKIEGIMRGIAEQVGGDNVCDITRILRIPETWNNKDKENPKKVVVAQWNLDCKYKLQDFEKYYKPAVEQTEQIIVVENLPKITPEDLKKYQLPIWVEDAILNGFSPDKFPKYKSRSELDFAVMLSLLKHNFTDEMIYSVFMNFPIGEKTREKGKHAITYFQITLKKAKELRDKEFREWVEKVNKFKDFNEVIKKYEEWFHIEDVDYLKIIHSVLIAHKFDAIPLWILLLAPPSGTKTSILQDLQVLDMYNVHLISELTAKTFVSGDKQYAGLLQEITNGIVIFKDFTTILQLDANSRNEILQQLREIWDGYYQKRYGTGKKVEWQGKLTILAGCTEAYETYREIDTTLGERFLIFRPTVEHRRTLVEKALYQVDKKEKLHKEIQETIKIFHKSIEFNAEEVENVIISPKIIEKLIVIADVVCRLRTSVKRDNQKHIIYVPEPEIPARLAQQLFILLKALTILNKKIEATEEELEIVKKVALMTTPIKKYKIIKYFIEKANIPAGTSDIAKDLNLTKSLVHYYCEDLWCFKLLCREGEEEKGRWYLNPDFYSELKEYEI